MGIKASSLRDREQVITVNWGDESLEVGVRPGRYTAALIQEMDRQGKEAERLGAAGDETAAKKAIAAVADLTSEVIAWWDVQDDDGHRLPVNAETLDTLPLAFVRHVIEQAGTAAVPPTSRG